MRSRSVRKEYDRREISFRSSSFNLSEHKEHFINPCCFGEDVAAWLREGLLQRSIPVSEPGQEDWGWYLEARHLERIYLLSIGGSPDTEDGKGNRGEWRIFVEPIQPFWKKILSPIRIGDDDPFIASLIQVLTDSRIEELVLD